MLEKEIDREVARLASLQANTVSGIYNNKARRIDLNTIRALCGALRCKPLPPQTGEPLEGSLSVSLEERHESANASESKNIYAKREFPFRCVRKITGWDCRWYESTVVEVEPPFQERLSRDDNITYLLSVGVEDASGMDLGSAELSFANLPTWCLWDVELDRPGGIEKVVNGRRIVAGTRDEALPACVPGHGPTTGRREALQ